jgi:tetratricopeptide (TPR) repeat protein
VMLIDGACWQTSYWRDSETLWTHTLACTPPNAFAYSNMGVAWGQQGKTTEAIAHLRKAVELNPRYVKAQINLGVALGQQEKLQEAIAPLQRALELDPQNASARSNLSVVLERIGVGRLREGKAEQAIAHLQKALEVNPCNADACNDLGGVYYQQGKLAEAIRCFQRAAEINPHQVDAHRNLGTALLRRGNAREALAQWHEVLRLQPKQFAVLLQTAWILAIWPDASIRNGGEAVTLARQALEICGEREPAAFDALAAAYAETGRFPEAVHAAHRAVALATRQNNPALADTIRARLKLYQSGSPYREAVQP